MVTGVVVLGLLLRGVRSLLLLLAALLLTAGRLLRRLLGSGLCSCELIEGVANLYIIVEVSAGDESALVRELAGFVLSGSDRQFLTP